MNQASNYSKPLPDCKGPKLKPFKDRKATIDFRRLLSAGESEEGGHAHVFEVSIKSVVYALKVVSPPLNAPSIADKGPDVSSSITITAQMRVNCWKRRRKPLRQESSRHIMTPSIVNVGPTVEYVKPD